MKPSSERFNDGLERAALHLERRADQLRTAGNATAETMARVFDEIATEILALRVKD